MTRAVVALLAIALVGCGDRPPPVRERGSQPAIALRADHRVLAALLAAERGSFVAHAGEWISQSARADTLAVRLIDPTGARFELRAGRFTQPIAHAKLEGVDAGKAELERGFVRYVSPDATRHSLSATDELLHQAIEGPGATRWWLELRPDVTRARRERSGAIVFEKANGDGVLRVSVHPAAEHALAWEPGRCSSLCGRVRVTPRGEPTVPVASVVLELVSWQHIATAAASPPAWRLGHAMAFDPQSGRVISFGGAFLRWQAWLTPPTFYNDTWAYDGSAKKWIEIVPNGATTAPSARWGHAMALHSASGFVIVHGGNETWPYSAEQKWMADAYRWNGTAWLPLPGTSSARHQHALADDPVRGRLVMLGGQTGDVLEWDGNAWIDPGQVGPVVRSHAMAFGPNNRIVAFGGWKPGTDDYHDLTWLYAGQGFTQSSAPNPGIRQGSAMVWDAARGVSVLFGGKILTQNGDYVQTDARDDTWEWDGSAWIERQTLTAPYKRAEHAMAYDPVRQRTVLFGGDVWFANHPDLLDELVPNSDTWEYLRYGGTCTTNDQCDGALCVDGTCCAATSCGVCERCQTATGGCQKLTGVDDPDTCTGTQTCDPNGACKKKLGQPCNTGAECVLGVCADGVCCDAPCDGACQACDGASSLGICTLVTGAPRHGSCAGAGPCASRCSGQDPDCVFPGSETDCGSTCSSAVLAAKRCNGEGSCLGAPPAACPAGFSCADGSACETSCADQKDCAAGFVCVQGECREGSGVCSNETTWQSSSGETKPCGAYRCVGERCLDACETKNDCADGYVCTPAGQCVVTPSSESPEGCGCRAAGGSGRSAGLAALGLLALAALRWRRRLGLLAFAACALGCEPAPVERAREPELAPPDVPATPLARARALAAGDGWMASVLAENGGFAENDRGELVHGQRLDRIAARLGERADDAVELRTGPRTRPLVSIHTLETTAKSAELADGHAFYRDALPGADLIWSVHGEALEQLLLVHGERERHFAWQLELSPRVTGAVRERDGALLFTDAHGDGLLRIARPVAIDARGERHRPELVWQPLDRVPLTGRIEIALGEGWPRPVLLDPVFEVVTWQELSASGPLQARHSHQLAWHDKSGKLVTFGGTHGVADTWAFDPTQNQWQELFPAAAPTPRHDYALAANAAGDELVLSGGRLTGTNTELGDTWIWNGANWTELSGAAPVDLSRSGHMLALDPQARVVMYGGYYKGDMWALSGGQWTPVTPATGTNPGVRDNAVFVFDGAANRNLLFGGGLGSTLAEPLVHEWNGSAWLEIGLPLGAVQPSAREGLCGAYDAVNQTTVIFGGVDFEKYYSETWEWHSATATFHAITPKTQPQSRAGHAMAYVPGKDRVILHGGYRNSNTYGDTWQYRRLGNGCVTSADCEGFECVDGVCCSEDACGTCQRCAAGGKCEPVLGRVDPDSCSGARICSATGACLKALGQSCGGAAECASGHCADGVCCNQACSGACQACDLAGSEGSCSLVSGAPKHGTCSGSGACASSCIGSSPDCVFPPAGQLCGASCTGSAITNSTCDGSGSCLAGDAAPCPGGYACESAGACKTSCALDSDCAEGRVCSGGACVADAICASPCEPYRCIAGACTKSCASAADCAAGAACTPDGRCTSPAGAGSDDGGCGCSLVGEPSSGRRLLPLVLVLLSLRTRSARRRPASRTPARCRSAYRPRAA